MYSQGTSSQIPRPDLIPETLEVFPEFKNALQSKKTCILKPGQALYIPALWYHYVCSATLSVSVNVFFRDKSLLKRENELQPRTCFYQNSDIFGNKHLATYETCIHHVDSIKKELLKLPSTYQKFYSLRVIQELSSSLDV